MSRWTWSYSKDFCSGFLTVKGQTLGNYVTESWDGRVILVDLSKVYRTTVPTWGSTNLVL